MIKLQFYEDDNDSFTLSLYIIINSHNDDGDYLTSFLTVTLNGGTFRGFLVQAQSPGCFGTQLPAFSVMSNEFNVKTLACSGQSNVCTIVYSQRLLTNHIYAN